MGRIEVVRASGEIRRRRQYAPIILADFRLEYPVATGGMLRFYYPHIPPFALTIYRNTQVPFGDNAFQFAVTIHPEHAHSLISGAGAAVWSSLPEESVIASIRMRDLYERGRFYFITGGFGQQRVLFYYGYTMPELVALGVTASMYNVAVAIPPAATYNDLRDAIRSALITNNQMNGAGDLPDITKAHAILGQRDDVLILYSKGHLYADTFDVQNDIYLSNLATAVREYMHIHTDSRLVPVLSVLPIHPFSQDIEVAVLRDGIIIGNAAYSSMYDDWYEISINMTDAEAPFRLYLYPEFITYQNDFAEWTQDTPRIAYIPAFPHNRIDPLYTLLPELEYLFPHTPAGDIAFSEKPLDYQGSYNPVLIFPDMPITSPPVLDRPLRHPERDWRWREVLDRFLNFSYITHNTDNFQYYTHYIYFIHRYLGRGGVPPTISDLQYDTERGEYAMKVPSYYAGTVHPVRFTIMY